MYVGGGGIDSKRGGKAVGREGRRSLMHGVTEGAIITKKIDDELRFKTGKKEKE